METKIKYRRREWAGTHTEYSWSDPIDVTLIRSTAKFIVVLSRKTIEGRQARDYDGTTVYTEGRVYQIRRDQVEFVA